MAAGSINISPFFLPWQQQGVEFLLQDAPVPAALSLCHARHALPPKPAQRPAPMQKPASQQHWQGQGGQKPQGQENAWQNQNRQNPNAYNPNAHGQNTHGQNAHYQNAHHGAAPAQASAQQAQRAQQPQQAQAWQQNQRTQQAQQPQQASPWTQKQHANAAPPAQLRQQTQPATQRAAPHFPAEQWPAHWQERLRLTKPARVIWTYWNLGHDLSGEASDARRTLLRKILTDLKHPAGTHAFWPLAMPNPAASVSGLEAHVPIFWSGVEQLGARVVVVLGADAAQALNFAVQNVPFTQIKHQGRPIILGKDMDELIEKPQVYDRMMTYLRPFLTQYLQLK